MHKPESLIVNEKYQYVLNFEIQTDKPLQVSRMDLVMNKEKYQVPYSVFRNQGKSNINVERK